MTIHHHSYSAPVFIGGFSSSSMGGRLAQLGFPVPPSATRPSAVSEMTPRLEASRSTGKRRASSFMVVNHSVECEAEVDRFVGGLKLAEYSQPEKVAKALRRLGRFCCGELEELKRASTMSRYVEQLRSFAQRGDLSKSTVKNEVQAVSLGLRALRRSSRMVTRLPRRSRSSLESAAASIVMHRRARMCPGWRACSTCLPSKRCVVLCWRIRHCSSTQEASLTEPEARRFRMGVTVLYLYAFGNFARKRR